jgi:acetoacetyl-CoA reductase/3-oxoacyl-[acyl-carrier protein] reductase
VIESLKGGDPDAPHGRPEEIAGVVAFLAADVPAYLTGQVWGVNGGLDM